MADKRPHPNPSPNSGRGAKAVRAGGLRVVPAANSCAGQNPSPSPYEGEGRGGVYLLRRLFQLWRVYAYLDLMMLTRDMKTFALWYGSDMLLNLASVLGMFLLAERFAGIGHWTKDQVVFMLGYATVVSGIIATLFSYNVIFISRRLGRGQLDHTLIQPQPLWLSLLTEGFSPFFGSAMLFPGLGLLGWAIHTLNLPLTPVWFGTLVVSLFSSVTVVFAFQFLWGSLAFWAPRAAEEINSSTMHLFDQLKSFPLDGLGTVLTGGLLTFLPVGFFGWLPCRALLGLDGTSSNIWFTPLAALAFALLAFAVFQRGLKHYGRVGSQRYTDFGHRN